MFLDKGLFCRTRSRSAKASDNRLYNSTCLTKMFASPRGKGTAG